jgi:hypothetical protein
VIYVKVQNPGEEPVRIAVPEGKDPFAILSAWQKSRGLEPDKVDKAFDEMIRKRKENSR